MNHRNVLNVIRIRKEVSGAEIARITKLQPSTIVYILRDLKKHGLIEISRLGSSTEVGGKPPTLWQLISKKGYIIGLEILPHGLRISLVDFNSEIIFQQAYHQLPIKGNPHFISLIKDIIGDIMRQMNLSDEKVLGIGVALPGLIDGKNGILTFSKPLALKKIPVKSLLEEALGHSIWITNDANAGALGIKWYPQETEIQYHHIIYLTINEEVRGIGAGLIIDQQLYTGATGTAGEIAAAFPPIEFLCQIGEKKFGKKLDIPFHLSGNGSLLLSKIAEYARNGCPVSNYVVEKVCDFLAREIFRVMIFINPDLIVIGGDIMEIEFLFNDFVIPLVKKRMRNVFPTEIEIPKICCSPFGSYSVSVGATALILREIFVENSVPS